MRNIIVLLISCLMLACEEERLTVYHGQDTVQFYAVNFDKGITVEYFWGAAIDPEAVYDTCWVTVQTMGHAAPQDRKLRIVQETAIGWDLVYDFVGNVVDSVSYVVPNQAVLGKHFVPFDEPGLQRFMKMPGNKYKTDIPVVMRKDPDTKKALTLQIRLVDTEDVTVGDPQFTSCIIKIE